MNTTGLLVAALSIVGGLLTMALGLLSGHSTIVAGAFLSDERRKRLEDSGEKLMDSLLSWGTGALYFGVWLIWVSARMPMVEAENSTIWWVGTVVGTLVGVALLVRKVRGIK